MIREKIQLDIVKAMKNREQEKLTTLRYILSKILNKKIEKGKELVEKEEIAILRKLAKEITQSIEAFKKGKRNDLVKKSEKEFSIVSFYLPAEISDLELSSKIKEIIKDNQQIYQKNPKAIMGIVIRTLKELASPKRIISKLNSILSE